eukprot:CAMPEP_0182813452 /NCGR_PEP_ID=MMETSP0006_2-20121128/9340_1 /TAXON_ID=97485 /ORGANISM="Prymnesium parvum, Strain Texoma1" /LENGTH=121 /DNA_ID=CAMNT_0024939535 /DNA_START=338 /DNA_END=703 /DNA_ORIENTATION=-
MSSQQPLYVMPPRPMEKSSSPQVSCHQKLGSHRTSPSCWSQWSAPTGLNAGSHNLRFCRLITSGGSLPGPPERLVPASGGMMTHRFLPWMAANHEAGWFSGGTPMPRPEPTPIWNVAIGVK